MTLAEAIKHHRKKAKLNQHELADLCGVKQSTITDFERGVQSPRYEMLERIAAACNIKVSRIVRSVEAKTGK